MTVIAYKDGVMAADRLQSSQWLKNGRATKISVIRNHLVGCSGSAALSHQWREWFARGADPKDYPDAILQDDDSVHALVVNAKGEIFLYQRHPYAMPITIGYYAIGSGQEVATAAILLGQSSAAAVELCNQICVGCGGGVDVLELEELDAAA